MANLHQLLKAMIEKGASDLHITTGTPPQLRIDGKLLPLKMPPLSPPETKQLCYSVLTDAQKHQFEETQRARPLLRRAEALALPRQRLHAAGRGGRAPSATIPFKILTFEELGLPQVVSGAVQEAARAGARDRPDGLGQVDHARVDHRQDQHRAQRAHRHDRGSDRVPAPRTRAAWSTSARSGADTHELQERAQVHPAPGPGRGADRRDARPRDDRGGADRRRDRPPRASPRCTRTRACRPSTASSTSSRPTSRRRCARSSRSCSRACCARALLPRAERPGPGAWRSRS